MALLFDVAIHEALVAKYNRTDAVRDGRAEARSVGDERVKFTSLPARINSSWKIGEECPVERASGERTVELSCVYAHDSRGEPIVDELFREC